jgi:hypothetical protein
MDRKNFDNYVVLIRSMAIMIVVGLALILVGCGSPVTQADAAAPTEAPGLVVEEFYRWYSAYPGNVLGDKEYQKSPYFSQEMIAGLDKLVEKGGLRADPIVCAQDIADSFTAVENQVQGNQARVRVVSSFGNEMDVELMPYEGAWKITKISCIQK